MTDLAYAWNQLEELLGPIHDDVQLFARRIARSNAEGDDVFQEAVVRAARKLSGLRDRSKFKSWMYSVVVSVHRTRCRGSFWKRWVRDARPDPVGDDGSRWADERASDARATAALGSLDPAQREAIVLFELHGYSIEEIAEIQSASIPSVKSRLVRGRDRLRSFYVKLEQPVSPALTTEEVCRG
ncbi:MAG TPA: RNA polymerase sigma factor [Kofleriaceae bacterium]|jgi:RNA polymerase sigma-70 factor (ECF subfamily)|nr:RNA polymerase sigma factor [Kofleriaceae bacterium]